MTRIVIATALLLTLPLAAAAQPEGVPARNLILTPAAEPRPALKYLLLPELRDQQPGNAALVYMRALTPEWYGATRGADWEAVDAWLEGPPGQMPKGKVAALLPRLALEEVDAAARREYCDWEMLTRLRKSGLATLVPDVQVMRGVGRLLALRARLEMAEGKFDKAVTTFQTGLALSRHLGEAPSTIHALVGLSVARDMLDQLEQFVQRPGAPNLYWALMNLPRPLIDMRRALQEERLTLDVHFPELKTLEKRALTVDEIARLTAVCCDFWAGTFPENARPPGFDKKLDLVGKVLKRYPAARKALADQGRTAEELDALPMLQVVLIYHYQLFRQQADDHLKLAALPYWQAHKALHKLRTLPAEEVWPFGEILTAPDQMLWAQVKAERRLAALACVEALRLHAATAGKLPASLDDLAVPAPADPVTGQPFQYKVADGVATLYGPPPPGMPEEGRALHYRITLAR
jgi:hypothetical protein